MIYQELGGGFMVVLLKILCFALWLCIMFFLFIAPQTRRHKKSYTITSDGKDGRRLREKNM
jgi:preprotein translocase subunit YajC